MLNWLKNFYAPPQNFQDETKRRLMEYLIEAIQGFKDGPLSDEQIRLKFFCSDVSMKDLAYFRVDYAIIILQNKKLISFLNPLELVELYNHYIKDTLFIEKLNSNYIPSLPAIVLYVLQKTNQEALDNIMQIIKNNPKLNDLYIKQTNEMASKQTHFIDMPYQSTDPKNYEIKWK